MAFKKFATSLFITTIVMLVSIEVAQAHEIPRKFGYGHGHEHGHGHHESEHFHIAVHAPHETAHPHPQHHHVGDEHVHTAAAHDPEPAHPHSESHPVGGNELLYGVSHPQHVGQAHEVESEKAYEECHHECMKNSFASEMNPTTAQGQCQWTCKDTVIRNNHVEHHSASLKPPCGNSP